MNRQGTEAPVVVLPAEENVELREGRGEMSEERRQILSMLSEGKVTVEEAEKLLAALGEGGESKAPAGEGPAAGKAPKYLRVLVQDGKENVNIRVPLGLVRAGMKLKALLPEKARQKIEGKLGEKGIDLGKLKGGDLDELLSSLKSLHVDVNGSDSEKVRIFCE